MIEVDFEYQIRKINLGPDDILVLKVDTRLTPEAMERIREEFKKIPRLAERKVLVLEKGMELSVLTAAEIAARAA